MSIRFFRNFVAWFLLTFIVVAAWYLYKTDQLSLSRLDAGIVAAAAFLITAVNFLLCRPSLLASGATGPRPRRFLGQLLRRLAGSYLILVVWSGTSYELARHSFGKQDLSAIITADFSTAPIVIIFVFWVIFSEWWSVYALAPKTASMLVAPVIPAAPVPMRREKPPFLTLDIYPKR